jgi:hypothetical protein
MPVKVAAAVAMAALALALGGCGGSQLDLPVKKVARRLPAIRGLHFKQVPEVRLVSKAEFAKIATRQALAKLRRLPSREHARAERIKAETRIAGQLPVLLGLVESLPGAETVGKVAQVEGVYDDDRVYLISDTVKRPRQAESVLSHELTHALEDQNLGDTKQELQSPLSDATGALRAVHEGSATLTQIRYARRYLGARESIATKLRDPPPDLLASRLARFVEDEADFIYRRGARFVYSLYRRGGTRLVNRALRHPPVTSASIFDPSRWPDHDRPRPPAGRLAPGPGWARSYSGDLGAALTRELLFLTGPGAAVSRIVQDWQGGTVELWQRPSAVREHAKPARATCVVTLRWRWRAAGDTAIARHPIDLYLRKAFHARRAGNGVWRWTGGGAALTSRGSTTTLVIAPTLATAAATAGGS